MYLKRLGVVFVFCCVMASIASASGSARTAKKFGVSGEYITNTPGAAMLNLNYNAVDFLRVHGGYGQFLSIPVNVIEVGAKAFVPDWDISPTVGLSYLSIKFGSITVTAPVANFGADYTTKFGLNIGGRYGYILNGVAKEGVTSGYLGFYF